MKKRALITGINGQDGGYLAEFLLSKGYEVFGMERRCSTPVRLNSHHLTDKITFLMGDLTDQNSLMRCLKESDQDEVYNLASQSFVGEELEYPEQTGDVTGLDYFKNAFEALESTTRILDFIKHQHQRCLVGWKSLLMKIHYFTHDHLMVLLNYMLIGLR